MTDIRIITNPGSNLPARALVRYAVTLTPQRIVIDDRVHDTHLDPVDACTIDDWVRTAKVHPYVVGTTAAEFVTAFEHAAARHRQILAVMTSRKVIGSYDAAVSAAKTFRTLSGRGHVEVAVADTGVTDLGAGLATMLAGEAALAGRSLAQIGALLEAYRKSVQFIFTVSTLDYLVKGGRATALRAWLANLLQVRPLIGFRDGELEALGKIAAKANDAVELSSHLVKHFGEGRRVYAAVSHGNDPEAAASLAEEMRKRFDVAYLIVQPLSPSIYLHGGPGCLCATAIPLDALPFVPPPPPSFG